MPLKTGTCDTCSAEKVKLRTNPFTHKEQCEDCRKASIIGITDIESRYKLKDADLKGLKMVTEPQPAFLGGPDRRWYLVDDVKKRVEEELEMKKKSAEVTKDNKRKKDEEGEQEERNAEAEPPVKRGRGRPKKATTAAPVVEGDEKPKRGRGRPRKVQKEEE
jgi:hypothetical protein